MKLVRARSFLILSSAWILGLSLSVACDPYESRPEGPAFVTLSGKVVAIPFMDPVPHATIETEDGTLRTTSDDEGEWRLENVPAATDPFFKITAEGITPSYNKFPLSIKLYQYDLKTMPRLFDALFWFLWRRVDPEGSIGAERAKACMIFGSTIGFSSMDYPQEFAFLDQVTVDVTPEDLRVFYLSESDLPLPDPDLTATSSKGLFLLMVPDATDPDYETVSLEATRPGSEMVGVPAQQTRPGSFIPTGIVDPLFEP